MAALQALGIDATVIYQFTLASFCFFALSSLVFKPYADALFEREKRTRGGEQEAIELNKQAAEMRSQFEQKAREINNEIKTIYESYRGESAKQYEAILTKARQESQKVVDESRARVSIEISEATKRMKEEIPAIAQAMSVRLLSKKG